MKIKIRYYGIIEEEVEVKATTLYPPFTDEDIEDMIKFDGYISREEIEAEEPNGNPYTGNINEELEKELNIIESHLRNKALKGFNISSDMYKILQIEVNNQLYDYY